MEARFLFCHFKDGKWSKIELVQSNLSTFIMNFDICLILNLNKLRKFTSVQEIRFNHSKSVSWVIIVQ